MPIYPALALLLGCAMDAEGRWVRAATKALAVLSSAAVLVIAALLFTVRHTPAPGDIAGALQQHPEAYTLSLGHMGDLTLASFAYLRAPLALAGVAFLVGAGAWFLRGQRALITVAAMMVLFFHASRLALKVFDPYLSSRALAEALVREPQGRLVVDGAYYSFSSVFFYANRDAMLLNGRVNNLEYGSYAPGAPQVFITDPQFATMWSTSTPCYLVTDGTQLSRLSALVGADRLHQVAESGGKFLFSNVRATALGDTSMGTENKPALW